MDASYNEMDVNMFNQYMYKTDSDNLNAALGQHHQQLQQQQYSQPLINQYPTTMSDQTFHTPSFGDEEFDIPVDLIPPAFQMHNDLGSLISDQQTASYDQWNPQTAANSHSMIPNQTFLPPSTDHSNYHPHQQMIMMQQSAQVHPGVQPASGIVSAPHQPQMSSAGGSNYVGQLSPQTAPINSNENGSTSDESDDNALNDPITTFQSQDSFENEGTKGATKKSGKAATAKAAKKKKRDPNEPQKPVSAYALFFRDTQAAIKGQNPNAQFGDVSKIVASMWDVLAPEHKNVYKKRTETAKKDYLKQLAAYRAGTLQTEGAHPQVSQTPAQVMTVPVVNPLASAPQQQQQIMQQNYQFAAQPQSQSATQTTQQQASQQTIATQQQQVQQFANQQPVQQNFQQQSQIINNNPLPPVVNQQANAAQNCIRNGCTNAAIISVDWEDEYCSNECCLSHCKDVFGNWVNQNNQQNFTVAT